MFKKKAQEQVSISKHLTKSYLMMFPLFIVTFFIVVLLGTFLSSGWYQRSDISSQHTAENLMNNNVSNIDTSNVDSSEGGVAIIYEDGTVQELGGLKLFESQKLSRSELTEFLSNVSSPNEEYVYSIAYNEQEDFWLVVGFPVSVRVLLSVATNPESSQYSRAVFLYGFMIAILLLLLFFGAWLYARYSSKVFITPLRKLTSVVKRMTRGEYEIDHIDGLTGEFLLLKNDIYKLSTELDKEKKLREAAEKEKKQNLMDISHDLRNPIATIMGYAETLSTSSENTNQTITRYADVILKNSIRANTLMNDLFTYTKLDVADFKADIKKADIAEFLREQISLFLHEFEIAGFNTEFEIPDSEIIVPFDANLLNRAIANLFTNCIQHNAKNTTFKLSLIEQSDSVTIIIEDDSAGMDKELANKAFDPFARLDKSRNSRTGGTGLGLAITSKIIAVHHGIIKLETSTNQGTRFIITLNK